MNIEEFYDLLKAHDWTYDYSDDHRHWQKGHNQREQLHRVIKQNEDDPRYRALFDQYRLWAFDVQGDVDKPARPDV